MIYTCTMSPSIDYTVFTEDISLGNLNRSDKVSYFPGGKGINVSRVLQRLGTENVALGFVGGFTGKFIADVLETEGIRAKFLETGSITRINIKIKANVETEINGPSPNIRAEDERKLLKQIELLEHGDYFVLAGSLPVNVSETFYDDIGKVCHDRGAHLILDTSGPVLRSLIKWKPFLMKPNDVELGELFQVTIEHKDDAVTYAKKLIEQGVTYVIVSLGGEGAIFVSKDEVYEAVVPNGKVVNTVGAGDSVVASFLSAYKNRMDVKRAFRYGVAAGSATAFKEDLCEREDVEQLVNQVIINKR